GGALCGTRGRRLPLIGFAVRLGSHLSGRFDVIYQGSFFTEGISTPHRNGQPCRAAAPDDPLEAINVRILERATEHEDRRRRTEPASALTGVRQNSIIIVIPRAMNFLFVHQYFPGQYVHLVRHLQEAGHNVIFVTQRRGRELPGVRILEYLPLPPSGAIPPHLQEVEMGVMNGLAVARLCEGLKREGFTPDVMIGHCGWGEVLFVKDVWPSVPLLGYFEFFYRVAGSDMDFDP